MTLYDRIMDKRKPKLDETTQTYADAFVESVNQLNDNLEHGLQITKEIEKFKNQIDETIINQLSKNDSIFIDIDRTKSNYQKTFPPQPNALIDTNYLNYVLVNFDDDPIINQIKQAHPNMTIMIHKDEFDNEELEITFNSNQYPYIEINYYQDLQNKYPKQYIVEFTLNANSFVNHLQHENLKAEIQTGNTFESRPYRTIMVSFK